VNIMNIFPTDFILKLTMYDAITAKNSAEVELINVCFLTHGKIQGLDSGLLKPGKIQVLDPGLLTSVNSTSINFVLQRYSGKFSPMRKNLGRAQNNFQKSLRYTLHTDPLDSIHTIGCLAYILVIQQKLH
jgi:hypothetical protein